MFTGLSYKELKSIFVTCEVSKHLEEKRNLFRTEFVFDVDEPPVEAQVFGQLDEGSHELVDSCLVLKKKTENLDRQH